ncbi:EamA-like transporter family protein [Devosia sp. YR412]|uniref:DMT family transporter n=1 Tax=Devosia sp. YR412 TaxID=1881030 RepID=UPI0008C42DB6|nr:DMT family transporter [Devosia sp. YR412]SEQ02550.1 EamA-like transporter family protein [Devosia sp. YR412]
MSRPVAILMLLICTALWGFAFVVQKSAMETMGPLTFIGVRNLLGGVAILPLALFLTRRSKPQPFTSRQWWFIAGMSLALMLGSWLQQVGLLTTTVTNGGFLTSLYVLLVPLIGLVVFRSWPHPVIWVGVPLALVGIYYLNGGGLDTLNFGDALVVGSAVFWAVQVMMLGYIARTTGQPILISCISFLLAGGSALALAFVFETPSIAGIMGGWEELAYAGLFSTAIAFTLQAVGQQHLPSANAAIILSSESLFAALGGAIFLGERLPAVGYAGATLIFIAILAVEALPPLWARRQAKLTN